MKLCSRCKQELPEEFFHKRTLRTGRIGLQHNCKECNKELKKKYYKPNEVSRRKLGISPEFYEELMKSGVCDVCKREMKKKCIDHCHTTGKVRGVLCNNCNTALGLVGDNVQILSELIRYLER
jgi:hypothetical protein